MQEHRCANNITECTSLQICPHSVYDREDSSLRRRRGWENECEKSSSFPTAHDILNAASATAVFCTLSAHATFIMKDINLFRDNQAGLVSFVVESLG
jgi:hypothetical protein